MSGPSCSGQASKTREEPMPGLTHGEQRDIWIVYDAACWQCFIAQIVGAKLFHGFQKRKIGKSKSNRIGFYSNRYEFSLTLRRNFRLWPTSIFVLKIQLVKRKSWQPSNRKSKSGALRKRIGCLWTCVDQQPYTTAENKPQNASFMLSCVDNCIRLSLHCLRSNPNYR